MRPARRARGARRAGGRERLGEAFRISALFARFHGLPGHYALGAGHEVMCQVRLNSASSPWRSVLAVVGSCMPMMK